MSTIAWCINAILSSIMNTTLDIVLIRNHLTSRLLTTPVSNKNNIFTSYMTRKNSSVFMINYFIDSLSQHLFNIFFYYSVVFQFKIKLSSNVILLMVSLLNPDC